MFLRSVAETIIVVRARTQLCLLFVAISRGLCKEHVYIGRGNQVWPGPGHSRWLCSFPVQRHSCPSAVLKGKKRRYNCIVDYVVFSVECLRLCDAILILI